jgi:hypothetical protein
MEVFDDFTTEKFDNKDYVMIAKREHNAELSLFSNLVLDLVDFKDRVRPLAKDMALIDATRKYQKDSIKDIEQNDEEFK